MTLTELLQGLRDIADFLEARPEMPLPTGINFGSYRKKPDLYFQPDKGGMSLIARHAHLPLKKSAGETMYNLDAETPTFTLSAYDYRERVCERVLVGEDIEPEHIIAAEPERIVPERRVPKYEYRCPKLLEPNEEAAEVEVA